MKKYITIIAILISFISGVSSQNIRNNITLELTGGLSPFAYKTNIGDKKGMAGTSVAIKYQYNLDWNWSIGAGVEMKMYQSSTQFETFSDSYKTEAKSLISGKADEMIFSYSYKGLEERQRALYINIPIYAQYRFDNGAYVRLGAKVGVPVKSGSQLYFEELTTKGYFSLENIEYTNLPQHGFGTFYKTEIDEEYKMEINSSLCAEFGWSWDWNERYVLYLGVHGEYGLCNIYEQDDLRPQLQYEAGNLIYNPIWSANINDGGNRVAITKSRVNTFAIGLLVRYSFGL